MATVTGLTAARMAEIEDASVVEGVVNSMGNLILTTKGGTEIDAGSVNPIPATVDVLGSVMLADNAEAIAGTATDRVITPANLAALPGYKYQQTVKYTSSGSFLKVNYPGVKAIRVRVQGGGGAGGSAQPASVNNHSKGAGGGGGGYAEKLILVDALAATETVTVGAGALGTTAIGAGNTGGTSSFGSHVSATGGLGGNTATNQALYVCAIGGDGGIGTNGDLNVRGGAGGTGTGYATVGTGGTGGSSVLGGGAAGTYTGSSGGTLPGLTGGVYGGGGGGAMQVQSTTTTAAGGSGAQGIVLVEVYV